MRAQSSEPAVEWEGHAGTVPSIKRRSVRWAGRGAIVLAVAAVLGALYPLYVVLHPRPDHPAHADALVVLSGDHGERLALAKKLLAAGVAPTLVLVGDADLAEDVTLCRGGQPFEVVCLHPEPDSTRTEASATATLAASRGWKALAVVTTIYHVPRARLLFERCFHGTLQVAGAPSPFHGEVTRHAEVHEWLGLIYARIWARHC